MSNKGRIILFAVMLVLLTSLAITMPTMAQDNCDPEADLSGWLELNGDSTAVTGHIVNSSSSCSYDVGLASYFKYENGGDASIPDQELAFSHTSTIAPNSQIALYVELPDCSTQIDLFYGDLIYSFTAENSLYGERLLAFHHRETYPCDSGGGDEGCTPGYWKNHEGFWSFKSLRYVDVFFGGLGYLGGGDAALLAEVYAVIGDLTLDDALSVRGNRFKYEALLRHSAAAMLSASHPEVDYPLSPQDVVASVRNAWTSWLNDDLGAVDATKTELDNFNNLGCDLGRFPYP